MPDKVGTESKMSMFVEETHEFHEDMTEVCSDMMAKYSFSTISNQPKRYSFSFFLKWLLVLFYLDETFSLVFPMYGW